jgi:hypothetical protein
VKRRAGYEWVSNGCDQVWLESADPPWCSLQRASADAQLASLAVGLSLAVTSDSRRKTFNSADLARAKEACGLRFNQRCPMRFDRWPKKVIAGALDKLAEQFKEEFVDEREVFLQMLEKLVKDNNKRITGEADKLR